MDMNVLQNIINNKWVRLGILIVAALAVLFLLVFVINWGLSNDARMELMEEGRFLEGVHIHGIDVSGRTMAEAKEDVIAQARKLLKRTVVRFRVGDTVYRLTGSQLGTLIDYQSVMEQAMLYGRDGSLLSDISAKRKARKEGVNFMLDVVLDESVLESTIKEMSTSFNSTVRDAQMIVDVDRYPSTYNVQSKIYGAEAIVGRTVDIRALMDAIIKAVREDKTGRTITAIWEETQPQITDAEGIMANCQLIGSFTTKIDGEDVASLHNVWKASGMLSGLKVEPKQTVSLLSVLGGIDEEEDWQVGKVIGKDTMADEFGGGISQVSSTLYAALLQAEIQVDTVAHYTWAPDYIAPGLDAKISREGKQDFVFTNQYDMPVYILVNCDGSKEKKLTVEVYGAPLEYTVTISAETLTNTEPTQEPVTTVDETKEAGYTEWVKPRKNQIKIDLWKIRKDASGQQIGDKIYLGSVEYPALPGEQITGPVTEETPPEGEGGEGENAGQPNTGEGGNTTGGQQAAPGAQA